MITDRDHLKRCAVVKSAPSHGLFMTYCILTGRNKKRYKSCLEHYWGRWAFQHPPYISWNYMETKIDFRFCRLADYTSDPHDFPCLVCRCHEGEIKPCFNNYRKFSVCKKHVLQYASIMRIWFVQLYDDCINNFSCERVIIIFMLMIRE